jgi:hypothetical protein
MLATVFALALLVGTAVARQADREDDLGADHQLASPHQRLAAYKAELATVRKSGGNIDVPPVPFFLFGMGPARQKLLFRSRGSTSGLYDALANTTLHEWHVTTAPLIVPCDYSVYFNSTYDGGVVISENSTGVWLKVGASSPTLLTGGAGAYIKLPQFVGHLYPLILRVLHQELLVNVMANGPTPNLWVYPHPWRRDGAMMLLALNATGNTGLLADWVSTLTSPFDFNAGVAEPDNLGETLALLTLAPKSTLVQTAIAAAANFTMKNQSTGLLYLNGSVDSSHKVVYPTKWFMYGLQALGLSSEAAKYHWPPLNNIDAEYASLFWMAYRKDFPNSTAISQHGDNNDYPYLAWARNHYDGAMKGALNSGIYPLSSEAAASRANYSGMDIVDPAYKAASVSVPHGWHAAEAFLALLTLKYPALPPLLPQ